MSANRKDAPVVRDDTVTVDEESDDSALDTALDDFLESMKAIKDPDSRLLMAIAFMSGWEARDEL